MWLHCEAVAAFLTCEKKAEFLNHYWLAIVYIYALQSWSSAVKSRDRQPIQHHHYKTHTMQQVCSTDFSVNKVSNVKNGSNQTNIF